mgnify:FL=1
MKWTCSLCGAKQQDGHQIDRAHVKGKTNFSEDERAVGFDTKKNIIPLCTDHHKLFDAAKRLAVVEINSNEDLYFARWGCCWEGICVKLPVNDTFRNLFLMSSGLACDKINREYIEHKNAEVRIAELYHFSKDITTMEYRYCIENSE